MNKAQEHARNDPTKVDMKSYNPTLQKEDYQKSYCLQEWNVSGPFMDDPHIEQDLDSILFL